MSSKDDIIIQICGLQLHSTHVLELLNILPCKVANEQRHQEDGLPLCFWMVSVLILKVPAGACQFSRWMFHTQHADVKHSAWHVRLSCPHIKSMKCSKSLALQFNEYFMLDQVWNPACISENRYSSAMNCLNPGCFATLTLATPQRAVIISRVANATSCSLNNLHYWHCARHKKRRQDN